MQCNTTFFSCFTVFHSEVTDAHYVGFVCTYPLAVKAQHRPVSNPVINAIRCEENVFFSRHKGNCYADSKTPSEAGQRVTCVIFIIMSTEVWMESGLYWPPYTRSMISWWCEQLFDGNACSWTIGNDIEKGSEILTHPQNDLTNRIKKSTILLGCTIEFYQILHVNNIFSQIRTFVLALISIVRITHVFSELLRFMPHFNCFVCITLRLDLILHSPYTSFINCLQ